MARKCVFCLEEGLLRPQQILRKGELFYLCVPQAQFIEGYLIVAPYRCVGALSKLHPTDRSELRQLWTLVDDFYRHSYGVTQGTYYEQGRGGRGASRDEIGGFPLHAHLCGLPVGVDLHSVLSRRYESQPVARVDELPLTVRDEPYVYVEGPDHEGIRQSRAYVATDEKGRRELESLRLKPTIAALLGVPQRGHWREYVGEAEVTQVRLRFRAFSGVAG